MKNLSTSSDITGQVAFSLLASYLFFLSRRPVSSSNTHYLARRIVGLRSLAAYIEKDGTPELKEAATRLRALNASSFRTLNRSLQFHLALVQQAASIPAHYIVTDHGPGPSFLQDVRRLLLICGPAIGIGDEIILFPLPQWFKASCPGLEVTVMSGYPGLWDRVNGPDRILSFSTHEELLLAIRGEGAAGKFDLVVLADFEKPGLAPVLSNDPAIDRYLEISLGGQCAIALDNVGERVSSTRMPLDAPINYYKGIERLVAWCGIHAPKADRYAGLIRRAAAPPAQPVRIFVSPFTSKYDPSVVFWSGLLASVYPVASADEVEFHLDPGPNLTTERFSAALAKSAAPRAGSRVRFFVASRGTKRTLDLAGVLECMETSHAVICSDSFAAHAGPLFELPTLVVARAGLENWRTPAKGSYYFDLNQAAAEIGRAMRLVIDVSLAQPTKTAAIPSEWRAIGSRLDANTRTLSQALAECAAGRSLNGEYDDFIDSYRDLVSVLPEWPSEYAGIIRDSAYGRVWRPAHGRPDQEVLRHLDEMLWAWESTNLRKLLRLTTRAQNLAAHAV
ncbi:MAG TPA: hypothetical protein VKB88_45075 [Bryobacteraceae bacterium]|nr:hypothetical protein [Bryobacteraceae bacterium]